MYREKLSRVGLNFVTNSTRGQRELAIAGTEKSVIIAMPKSKRTFLQLYFSVDCYCSALKLISQCSPANSTPAPASVKQTAKSRMYKIYIYVHFFPTIFCAPYIFYDYCYYYYESLEVNYTTRQNGILLLPVFSLSPSRSLHFHFSYISFHRVHIVLHGHHRHIVQHCDIYIRRTPVGCSLRVSCHEMNICLSTQNM